MRYLITGGAGFIGSHLADYLIERGHVVDVLDTLETGSINNIAHLRGSERFSLTVGSVLDYDTLESLLIQADRVVHLAAVVGVRLVMEQPVETIVTNVHGTENVLKLCCDHQKRVLLASTSEVYGKTMDGNSHIRALNEDDDLTLGSTKKRRWAYGCTKAVDEFLARAYFDQNGLEVVVVRFFNTVGPRQTGSYGMVVPRFVRQAMDGEPLIVHGDGSQSRCFTHVADSVEAVARLMEQPEAFGEIVNIGNNEQVTINQLARRVIKLTGSTSSITHVPYEEVYGPGYEDMHTRRPDASRLKKLVGFVPQRALDDALRDVIASFTPVLTWTA
jgi:UDP-glucose 4-epimerase